MIHKSWRWQFLRCFLGIRRGAAAQQSCSGVLGCQQCTLAPYRWNNFWSRTARCPNEGHSFLKSSRAVWAALRPAAPMTPPPGKKSEVFESWGGQHYCLHWQKKANRLGVGIFATERLPAPSVESASLASCPHQYRAAQKGWVRRKTSHGKDPSFFLPGLLCPPKWSAPISPPRKDFQSSI